MALGRYHLCSRDASCGVCMFGVYVCMRCSMFSVWSCRMPTPCTQRGLHCAANLRRSGTSCADNLHDLKGVAGFQSRAMWTLHTPSLGPFWSLRFWRGCTPLLASPPRTIENVRGARVRPRGEASRRATDGQRNRSQYAVTPLLRVV